MKYNVLLIDDDSAYYNSQKTAAAMSKIQLDHIDDWETAKNRLLVDPDRYDAVIIDGKGRLRPDERGEDQRMLTKAIEWFREQKASGKFYNFVVNSGFINDISEFYDFEGIPLYEKGYETQKLFPYIVDSIERNSQNRFKHRLPEISLIFQDSKYLDESLLPLISELYSKMNNRSVRDSEFNTIRKITERVFDRLHQLDKHLIPAQLFYPGNGTPMTGSIFRYFMGREVSGSGNRNAVSGRFRRSGSLFQDHELDAASALDKLQRKYSHDDRTKKNAQVDSLTFNFTMNCLFIFLGWFKRFIDEHYAQRP